MLKKTSDDAKKRVVFFIDFSSIFREKSTENHAKSVKTGFVHKNRSKITFGTAFFSQKSIFGVPLARLGPPGTSRERSKIVNFSHLWSIAPENESGRPPGGSREAAGPPPRRPQGTILRQFLDRFCT